MDMTEQPVALHQAPIRRVDKYPLGHTLQHARDLSSTETADLLAWHTHANPSDTTVRNAQAQMETALLSKQWFACNCRPDRPEDPPILAPLPVGDHGYTWRRLPRRTSHAPSCKLRLDPTQKRPPSQTDSGSAHDVRADPDLLRGKRDIETPSHRRGKVSLTSKEGGARHDGETTLHAGLVHLLTQASRHLITAERRTFEDEVDAVRAAAAQLHHRSRPELSLDRCLMVDPPAPDNADLLERLFAPSRGQWPKGELPVGYVLLVCNDLVKLDDGRCALTVARNLAGVEGHASGQWALRGQPLVHFDCAVHIAEEAGHAVRAPYLVLFRATVSRQGIPSFVEGIAHPIASTNCWVPVRSIAEREAADALHEVARELQQRRVDACMQVVLRALKTDDGLTCHPDFVVRSAEPMSGVEPLFIETQKTTDPAYHEGKVGPHAVMRTMAELYIDDRLLHNREMANALLRTRVLAYFGMT